jgi:hypothetical protein
VTPHLLRISRPLLGAERPTAFSLPYTFFVPFFP